MSFEKWFAGGSGIWLWLTENSLSPNFTIASLSRLMDAVGRVNRWSDPGAAVGTCKDINWFGFAGEMPAAIWTLREAEDNQGGAVGWTEGHQSYWIFPLSRRRYCVWLSSVRCWCYCCPNADVRTNFSNHTRCRYYLNFSAPSVIQQRLCCIELCTGPCLDFSNVLVVTVAILGPVRSQHSGHLNIQMLVKI